MPPDENVEMTQTGTVFTVMPIDTRKDEDPVTFEEALENTGFGRYTWTLFFICAVSIMICIQEIFGTSFLVAAATCDLNLDTYKKGIITGIPFGGVVISAPIWGYIADTKGRLRTMLISMAGGAVMSFISCWSTTWILLAIAKFFSAAFASATNAVAYTLFSESCPQSQRNKMVLLMSSGLMASQAMMCGIAFPVLSIPNEIPLVFMGISWTSWRLLGLTYCLFLVVFGILTFQFSHESPKFYLSLGREEECLKVLKDIQKSNCGKTKEFQLQHVVLTEHTATWDKNQSIIVSMWKQTVPLFSPSMLKKTLVICYMVILVYSISPAFILWFPTILNVYSGTMRSGVTSGSTFCQLFTEELNLVVDSDNSTILAEPVCNDQINTLSYVFLASFSLALAFINAVNSLLVKYTGKKRMMIGFHVLAGVTGIALNYLYNLPLSLICFFLMCITNVTMGICTSFTVETYPTYYRGMALCLTMMLGRGASIFTVQLIGTFLEKHCEYTIYTVAFFLLSGAVVSCFLSSEKQLAVQKK